MGGNEYYHICNAVEQIAPIGLTILFTFAHALHDAYRIKQNKPIYHGLNIAVRLIVLGVLALWAQDGIIDYLKNIVAYIALFWLLFDYAINTFRNKFGENWIHWWYVSGEGIDGFLGKNKGYTYRYLRLSIKFILFITTILL